jgi:hypothetical protein
MEKAKKLVPVRKIKAGINSLRGQIHSPKNGSGVDFESGLERDYLKILEFDINVDRYVEQPIDIKYEFEGMTRHYFPDVLIYYRDDIEPAKNYSPLLVEVKYSDALRKKKLELKPKFAAASKYAESKGWRFMIVTEKEIRTHYLENINFLLPYRNTDYASENDASVLMDWVSKLDITTPEEIIIAGARDKYKQAELLYCLWHLISIGFIGCDLSIPLTMKSEIWAK